MKAIYEIRCLINDKVYVGQTIDFERRKQQHINLLNKNKHDNPYLQEDFNKYGISNFKFTILEDDVNTEDLLTQETYYINMYGGINSDLLYNQQDMYHQSEIVKYKNRLANLGKTKYKMTEEIKQKISNKNKGKKFTDNVKKLWSEQRQGCKNGMYGVHRYREDNPNYGKRKYSEEFICKLREEFKEGATKKQLSEKYNIHNGTICNLINYGVSQHPKNYK